LGYLPEIYSGSLWAVGDMFDADFEAQPVDML